MIVGCAFPEGEQGMNVARLIGLLAELPLSVAGATVNRFCGSSMQAIHMAAGAIQLDAGEVFVCAGVESMTRVPIGGFNPLPNPRLMADVPAGLRSAWAMTAENVAAQLPDPARGAGGVRGREPSQGGRGARRRAASRTRSCRSRRNGEVVDQDGCIRPDTSPRRSPG